MPGNNGGRSQWTYAWFQAAQGNTQLLEILQGTFDEERYYGDTNGDGCTGGLSLGGVCSGTTGQKIGDQVGTDGEIVGTVSFIIDTNPNAGGHRYVIEGVICNQGTAGCDEKLADQVFGRVNQNDIPIIDDDLGTGFRTIGPGQTVFHEEFIDQRVSTNTTVPGHIFHPGEVRHSVSFVNGNLVYAVTGTGTGACYGLPYCNAINNVAGAVFIPGVVSIVQNFILE